ncbi:PEP-CTERM sorting domain-containing protein [Chamaesiphon sp.]|uniref:PEP-CTERM sorting domain-containing protein n=1 Tax=Chamaesiphon sp. TaxID=2814140 RepID=UPI00359458DA
MKLKSWVLIIGMAAIGIVASGSIDRARAVTITLYDGASGFTPDAYTATPYFYFGNEGGSQSVVGGATRLNTSAAELIQDGYSNYDNQGQLVNGSFPILDNNVGYTLSFTVKVNSQTNNGTNGDYRAGFSAIVLGSNKQGIELGFRNPNTQDLPNIPDIFSQASASFNTLGEQNANLGGILGSLTKYDLQVLGNNYTLTSGANTLLSGSLRDYTAAIGALSGVYRTPNLIFLGDNTQSAGASVDITNIALTTNTPVPEPSSTIGIGLAIAFAAKLRRKLSKIDRQVTKLLK